MQGIKKKNQKKKGLFYFQIHKLKFLYLAVYIEELCPQCMDWPDIKSFELFLVYIEYFWPMGSTLRCIDILFGVLYLYCNGVLFAVSCYNFSKIAHVAISYIYPYSCPYILNSTSTCLCKNGWRLW